MQKKPNIKLQDLLKSEKTVTRTISIPKTKIIKQPVQQINKSAMIDAAQTAIKPTAPQKPLSNQQSS